MDYSALERNVIEVMEEEQVKLGFDTGAVNLFYPLSSLALMLGTSTEEKTLTAALNGFCAHVREKLGEVSFEVTKDRARLIIPKEGGEYVKSRLREDQFIVRLIRMVGSHRAGMDEVLALFHAYSSCVHVEKTDSNGEFDYLVYFEDGEPDAFYYCLKEDMGHVTYHRFLKSDYEAFGF